MDSKLLYNQIKEQLPPLEGVSVKVEDNKMNFYIDGRLEFYVRESGGVSYMPNCSDTDKVKNICGEIVRTSRFVREYLETIDQAPDFEVEGLKNKYKLLAQFNNTVLAARVNGGDHVEFVTWDKDSRGVSAGNYFGNNFTRAKEDFAVRANIVNRDKIFSTSELVEIYRCIDDTLGGGYEISDEQVDLLNTIKDKITEVVPDVIERAVEAQEQYDQEPNNGMTMN